MKLLVIDGNSILNRAFYGIKLLTTKDGRFTNGIYGFMKILTRLSDEVMPEAVAIAFDVKAPTFRHKMYDGYKAQRKGMPEELAQQLPVLKELLAALGYKTVECEGWEADDILGTLASACGENECYIATGDRDSLQLVGGNVKVLLTSTKMGRPQTVCYDEEKILEEYGVEPKKLIDIKALMGDSSDNIPGVAGIGQKTASELVARFGGIEKIYSEIDSLDIRDSVRAKLAADRDMAFLSRTLGTISIEAPVDKSYAGYIRKKPDVVNVTRLFSDLEMFKLLEEMNFDSVEIPQESVKEEQKKLVCVECDNVESLLAAVKAVGKISFAADYSGAVLSGVYVLNGNEVSHLPVLNFGFMSFVTQVFEDSSIKKITFASKNIFAFAIENGIAIEGEWFDIQLAGYVLNPSSSDYSPSRLAMEYSADGIKMQEDAPEISSTVAVLPSLAARLAEKMKENGQTALFSEIEMPLCEMLASMELVGFEVDAAGIAEFGKLLDVQITTLTSDIYNEAGFEFNLNSPKQLGEALFVKLGLPAKKKTKSGFSTNADVLEALALDYPIVEKILSYRTLAKLKSTYCDGLLKQLGTDGRIHSTLNQTETRTGRISSTEPNLQNIPVRSELGKEIRKFFRAKSGCLLADADYSQIELRVLAHIADDTAMIDAFNDGDDIHAITASQVFNLPLEMVNSVMRSRAKAVNFGIVYGIGAFSLAKDIGVTRAEADSYIKGYLSHYAGVNRYMEEVVASAKRTGYVKTMFERRRYLPELSASNGMLRAFGERVARNMPIQGTAADIIKIAMVRVYKRLKAEKLNARLIMQVHDELIVEASEADAERTATILKEEMETAVKLKVKLSADVGIGKTWYSAKA